MNNSNTYVPKNTVLIAEVSISFFVPCPVLLGEVSKAVLNRNSALIGLNSTAAIEPYFNGY